MSGHTECRHFYVAGMGVIAYGACTVRRGGHRCSTCCFECTQREAREVEGKIINYRMPGCDSPCPGPEPAR